MDSWDGFCGCAGFSVSLHGDFTRVHRPSCVFGDYAVGDNALDIQLLRRSFNHRNSTWHDSIYDGDDDVGDVDFFQFPSSYVNELLLTFNRDSLFDSVSGGARPLLSFRLLEPVRKKALKGGVKFRISRLNVVESASKLVGQETKLRDVMASFAVIFEQIVSDVKKEAKPDDLVQFIVYTEKTPAFDGDSGMVNPISTPLIPLHQLNKNAILPFIISNFKEYDHIVIGNQIVIESVVISRQESENDHQTNVHGSGDLTDHRRLNGIVRIQNNDSMCLARAVVVCHAQWECSQCVPGSDEHKTAIKRYEQMRHGEQTKNCLQTQTAETLCVYAGVKVKQKTSHKDIEKISNALQLQIKIVSAEGLFVAKTFGDPSWDSIYLLERRETVQSNVNFHFDAIVNMRVLKKIPFYCFHCDVGFKTIQGHICPDVRQFWCFACFTRKCALEQKVQKSNHVLQCSKCGVSCRNDECKQAHEKLKICKTFFCNKCRRKMLKATLPNGMYQSDSDVAASHKCLCLCNLCGREKHEVHKCFMLRQQFREKVTKLLFLDFETDQSSGEHIPIYCVLSWVIFDVDEKTGGEFVKAQGCRAFGVNDRVSKDVGKYLFFSKEFEDFTIIAHNMRGFDGCFLLRFLIENNINVQLVCNGLKLTSMFVPSLNIRLVDSLNFFQMSLAGIVSAMGIENEVKCKGYFPHFFTSPETLSYVGPMPRPEDFGCFDFKSKQYKDFMAWYEQHKNDTFDFQAEVEKYCHQDVKILEKGCLKFRELVIDIVKNISEQPDKLPDEEYFEKLRKLKRFNFDPATDDPCEGEIDSLRRSDEFDLENICDPFAYLTAPGMCSAIFKARFLKKNSIAQVLPSGYENFRHSQVGLEYVEYVRRTKFPDLLHAQNTHDGKEICVLNKYRVDGFVPSENLVVEFHGCFWHGCPTCVKDPSKLHPVQKVTYAALYEKTLRREQEMKNAGFSVQSMWECMWRKIKKTDSNVKAETDSIHIKSRLAPREAFRGGRVETGQLIWTVSKSKYKVGLAFVDICSLYPTVNCYDPYPVGHGEVITANFGPIESYFGLIQCCVLPPQNLKFAILPMHCNGKLLFPLCRTCAETFQFLPCKHSEDERCLYGVWVSEELKLALKMGYVVKHIYCVHHFSRKSSDLFSGYIRTFFKLKLGSSKRPFNESEDELKEFIDELKVKESIEMKPSDFRENPGVRSIAKLCCNCFWGRLGMRDAFPKVSVVHTLADLNSVISSNEAEVTTVRYLSDSCVAVLSKNKSVDTVTISNNTNIYLAVFTTAYARIRLFKLIDRVKDRFVYCDTDSVIYELSPNAADNLPTGEFMGDLTSELDFGETIVDFVSGGPKVYAFKTSKNKCVVKIKGFQLNETNKAAFSFENLKTIVSEFVSTHLDKTSGRVNQRKLADFASIRKELFSEHFQNISKSSAIATRDAISSFNANKISRSKMWELFRKAEQKMYTYNFDKRIVLSDYSTVPYGFV